MTRPRVLQMLVVAVILLAVSAGAEPLTGKTGREAGNGWQSSWLDLKPPLSFRKGEKLRITVSGDAKKVFIRLLPAASPYQSSDGLVGGVRTVPPDGLFEITLDQDHPNVKQISVHAGEEAWGNRLGADNGTVQVVSCERIS